MDNLLYKKLHDNLFVDVDYPAEVTNLIGEAKPWRNFCALPREIKDKFAFLDHQEELELGYRFRSLAEGREDKEYFHAYANMFELIEKDGNDPLLEKYPELKEFFIYAVNVQKKAHNFALEIGRQLGESIPELTALTNEGEINSVLRMLHYTNDDQVDVIASQHFDRSLYTLHLYESDEGLQFMNWNMQWSDAPIDIGKTVVFSGYRLENLTKGAIQKTWHRVVRKGKTKNRVSMVLFVWSDSVSSYPREARSQDLEPSYRPRT